MPISHPITPPIKISTATFSRTINPTAKRAGETSPPKKKILFPLKNAVSSPPFKTPANEMRPLKAPPNRAPLIIEEALLPPDSCPASSTDAQASPSGY